MSAAKDGGPAFPLKEPLSSDCQGMSLRDHFAGLAMQGLIYQATRAPKVSVQDGEIQWVARKAYAIADDMLAQREKGAAT